ncbi:hypothetical protein BK716_03725 [Bacillus thuringiensis serovar higo]|uniref:DUF1722 domain-containing protein n=2 Tax=Bacillus thuringiensis TaxID=1428 RepID=A0A9X6LXE7_BACUH|nr:hypothetical protein BK716_03725 [Bacillus thuringiensis serovar higo]
MKIQPFSLKLTLIRIHTSGWVFNENVSGFSIDKYSYFKKNLKNQEKEHFLTLLQKYKEKKIPLSSLLSVLKSWALRFEEQYLLRQTYFEPYPETLVEISDSGKGRDY